MKLKIGLAAGLALTAGFASAAQALPVYFGYSINGGPITAVALADGGGGFSASSGGLFIGGSAIGTPYTQQPDFLSSQTTVSLTGAPALVSIYLSQTGLDFQAPGFLVGYGSNSSAVSITESAYVQNCVAVTSCNSIVGAGGDVFSTANLLATKTIAPGDPLTSDIVGFPVSITPGNLYSETLVYTFNFAGGFQSASATFNLQNVPEPLSLGLFGAGLVGLTAMRRRKKAT